MRKNNNFLSGFFSIITVLILSCLIFYQVIITLILPLRFNIFILLIEVFLLFYVLYRIIYFIELVKKIEKDGFAKYKK